MAFALSSRSPLRLAYLLSMSAAWALPFTVSCQRGDKGGSQLKHIEADLQRPDATLFVDCHQSEPADETLSPMQKVIKLYLNDLAEKIMNRANESLVADGHAPLFAGELAPEKFCFWSPNEVGPTINASAESQRREVGFLPGTFLALPHEPALAGVMCHELAHVTMRHGTSDDVRPDIKKSLMSSPSFDATYKEAVHSCNSYGNVSLITPEMIAKIYGPESETSRAFAALRQEESDFVGAHLMQIFMGLGFADLNTDIFACRNRAEMHDVLTVGAIKADGLAGLTQEEQQNWTVYQAELAKMESDKATALSAGTMTPDAAFSFFKKLATDLDQAYGAGRNSFISWKEQEADEVGYEICLRAGIDVSAFVDIHKMLVVDEEKDSANRCLSDIEEGRVPARKLGVHPTACWRIFDIEKREQSIHAPYYHDLLARVPRREVLGADRLEAVMKEIHAAEAASPAPAAP